MKYTSILGSFIVALVVLFVIVLYNEKAKRVSLSRLLEQTVSKSGDLYLEQDYRNAEIFLNGKRINKDFSVSDGKGHPIEWSELIDGDKLVLLFSEGSCDECVNTSISQLEGKETLIGKENIVILISALTKRYVAQYKSNTNLKYPIAEVNIRFDDLLSMPPCFFVIEKESMRLNSAYFPRKENPEGIGKYLDKIAGDYFNVKIDNQ